MTSLFGEASTVVGDHFKPGGGEDTVKDFASKSTNSGAPPPQLGLGHPSKSQPKEKADEFVDATMDYTLEDRPFFIRIGKQGVVAALEKLDEQLVQAGRNKVLSTKVPTDWTGKEVVPGRLGLINHG